MANLKKKARPLRILVSNDDGVQSHGLQCVARALKKIAHVTVVAPEREQSTMGHALTLHKPVRLFHVSSEPGLDQWALSGTPADCVYMGLRWVLKEKPDLIVSGINRGVNVGNDIYYSGTIAAAREGAVMDIPAMAASLDYHHEVGKVAPKGLFEDAADFIQKMALNILQKSLPPFGLLNVNFPFLPFSKIKGVKIARQGFRLYTDSVEQKRDSRGKPYYWLGGRYAGFRPIENSDCEVLDKGFISVTPCRIDVTHYDFMESLSQWKVFNTGFETKAKKSSLIKAKKRKT